MQQNHHYEEKGVLWTPKKIHTLEIKLKDISRFHNVNISKKKEESGNEVCLISLKIIFTKFSTVLFLLVVILMHP